MPQDCEHRRGVLPGRDDLSPPGGAAARAFNPSNLIRLQDFNRFLESERVRLDAELGLDNKGAISEPTEDETFNAFLLGGRHLVRTSLTTPA